MKVFVWACLLAAVAAKATSFRYGVQLCEKSKYNSHSIKCSGKNEEIIIIRALYGRKSTQICSTYMNKAVTNCGNDDSSLTKARDLCDHKKSCTLTASNAMFGDPCAGIDKYLRVIYECKIATPPPTPDRDVNWALNKPSKQSSTYGYGHRPDCDAKLANDGSMETRSATQDYAGAAWWEVNLQKVIKIKDVTLRFNEYPLKKDYYQNVEILTKESEKGKWTVCKKAGHLTQTPVILRCDRPTKAQFVRVAMKSKTRLYLGEVEVHRLIENVALNKPSEQSTTYGYGTRPDCNAKLANDGSMKTRSVTQDYAGNAWWQVNLRKNYEIIDVTLKFNKYPLKDKDYYRNVVILTKSERLGKWKVCKKAGHLTSTPSVIKCDKPTTAQFVRVALKSKTRLYLAEVEVHA